MCHPVTSSADNLVNELLQRRSEPFEWYTPPEKLRSPVFIVSFVLSQSGTRIWLEALPGRPEVISLPLILDRAWSF